MEENKEVISKNFIEQEIEKDLAEGVYDHVQTRFPPEPNGYLHIGHAKSILLNYGLAEKYHGKFNMRFDDTNPTKEKTEFVESILADVKWLGADFEDRLFFASNYFEKMYECAVFLIQKGKAFVCDLSADEMREYRGDFNTPGKESPYRNRSIEENMRLFEEMRAGTYADGEKVLRAKIDMASANINMRDPVIYRVARMSHHNTGDSWCIYPMYDFAHPIEDAVEHITHSICTLEFEDHRPLYDWVVRECQFENPPRQIEFAKLYLTNVITGKRYIKKLVEDGLVDGWDDPRLVSIAALRRRGYTPESIRKFVDLVGVSKANSSVDYAMLEYCIREDLKLKRARMMAILDPIKLVIDNYPEGQTEELDVPNNLENPDMGDRKVPFAKELYIERDDFMEEPPKKYFRLFPGNEVRLMAAYFVTCTGFEKDEAGRVTVVHATYDPETKSGSGFTGRKVKGTIHWVAVETAQQAECRLYENIVDEEKGKLKADGSLNLNPNSLTILKNCYVEPSFADAKAYDSYQFVRNGFFCIDCKD
ncbi:MAG: glutamine--tRNA ligase/YqeY domain fusion protein, partial [Hungatella sp.]